MLHPLFRGTMRRGTRGPRVWATGPMTGSTTRRLLATPTFATACCCRPWTQLPAPSYGHRQGFTPGRDVLPTCPSGPIASQCFVSHLDQRMVHGARAYRCLGNDSRRHGSPQVLEVSGKARCKRRRRAICVASRVPQQWFTHTTTSGVAPDDRRRLDMVIYSITRWGGAVALRSAARPCCR